LKHQDVSFDRTNILKLVKKSFDGFKIKAQADKEPERAATYKKYKKGNRRRQRRLNTYKRRKNAVLAYEEEHGINPSEVIDLEFVSDYASRPESLWKTLPWLICSHLTNLNKFLPI
jgi:hypothetical protein